MISRNGRDGLVEDYRKALELVNRAAHTLEDASVLISGESGTVTVIHNPGNTNLKAQRVAVAGLGKQPEFDLEAVRIAAAVAARKARDLRLKSFTTIAPSSTSSTYARRQPRKS